MSTTKIVRKREQSEVFTIAFWLDARTGQIRGSYDLAVVEHTIARNGGWEATEVSATRCGTTLSAIRAELLALETPAPDAPLKAALAQIDSTPDREDVDRDWCAALIGGSDIDTMNRVLGLYTGVRDGTIPSSWHRTPTEIETRRKAEREELVKLQRFAGMMMACANAGTDGGYIQDTAVELGLMVPTICDESCEYCCGEPGEDTCYRPRYDEDGTPVGDTTRKDGTG